MKVCWASNSPFNYSGYGVQTMLVTPRLKALGHDVAIAANYGVVQCVLGFDDSIPVYPQGGEDHSILMCEEHANHIGADILLTHYDAWVYDPSKFQRPWVPWFPVDCDDLQVQVEEKIRSAAYRITQTRHGQAATQAKGLQCAYVPASFSAASYHPDAELRATWREGAGIKPDEFLVTMIAANKGAPGAPSRKSFPQVFDGFRLFLERVPNAKLYVHSIMNSHLNLPEMATRMGIIENVSFSHPYPIASGLIGFDDMRMIYNAADVLVSPSMGEGFGVPIVEAQACGTRVVTGDWTAMSEITRSGVAIPKSEAVRFPLQWSLGTYGDMFIVKPEAVRDALVDVYESRGAQTRDEVAAGVAEYEVDRVFAEHWTPVLGDLEALVGQRSKAVSLAEEKRARRAAKRRTIQGAPEPSPAA